MRRIYRISDYFYKLTYRLKRNRTAVVIYGLLCIVFLVIGIAVGVRVADKPDYILRNSAAILKFLRGDMGIIAFLFADYTVILIYGFFAASMFIIKPICFLSVAPAMYKAYMLGMQICVLVGVYTASAVPMLMVLYVPVCLAEIIVLCYVSARCFAFTSGCRHGAPAKIDIKLYYITFVPIVIVFGCLAIVKTLTLGLFGSALIGII